MHLTFKETKEEVYAAQRVSKHVSPHLHNALEIVCVTEGTLEMGVGQELYHMEKGDIGFVFSDIIHHYQVLSEKTSRADHIKGNKKVKYTSTGLNILKELIDKRCQFNGDNGKIKQSN